METTTKEITVQDKKDLLNNEDRTALEGQFKREHQEVVRGLSNLYKHFHRASDLLLKLYEGTAEGQWENVLSRLNIARSTAYRYLGAARDLKQIPAPVKAAVESNGRDLTSLPVRRKVLELQKTIKEPDKIAERVGEEYRRQRKRRTGKHPSHIKPTAPPTPDDIVTEVVKVLDKAKRMSPEDTKTILNKVLLVVQRRLEVL